MGRSVGPDVTMMITSSSFSLDPGVTDRYGDPGLTKLSTLLDVTDNSSLSIVNGGTEDYS